MKVKVNDIEMEYEIRGSGYPLLLIMGWTANKEIWPRELLDPLSEHYQLILFDNRGAGRSGSSRGSYRMQQFAKDTIGLMDTLGISQAHLFGISLGGMIAQEIALTYPNRINKLILGCTLCGTRYSKMLSWGLAGSLLKYATSRDMNLNQFLLYLTLSRDTRDLAVRQMIKAGFEAPYTAKNQRKQLMAIFRFNSYPRLPQIRHQTLVLVGTKDLLVHPKNSEILARRIPNAQLIRYKGMSHAFFADAPDKVSHDLMEFLA